MFEIKKDMGHVKGYINLKWFIFEGEYLNWEKNGKGKEYDNKGLLFVEEFLNDKNMEKKLLLS